MKNYGLRMYRLLYSVAPKSTESSSYLVQEQWSPNKKLNGA